MADWQRKLNLKDVWEAFRMDGDEYPEEPINKLAGIIADRLEKLTPFGDEAVDSERERIVEEFRDFAKDEDDDREQFYYLMDELCDWGDTKLDDVWPYKKVCWIATTI